MSDLAKRNNKNKPRYSLIPNWLLKGVAYRLEAGAEVYGNWNWTKGDEMLKLIDSLERHIAYFKSGETIDPDKRMKGTDHIDAIICNAIFIKNVLENHPELDDRYKPDKE